MGKRSLASVAFWPIATGLEWEISAQLFKMKRKQVSNLLPVRFDPHQSAAEAKAVTHIQPH